MRSLLVGLLSVVLCVGCAGVSPAQMGQTAGTIAGAAIVPGVGAPLGALVGLLAGLIVQQRVDEATENRERKELSEELQHGQRASSEEAAAGLPGRPTRG